MVYGTMRSRAKQREWSEREAALKRQQEVQLFFYAEQLGLCWAVLIM